MRVTGGTTDMDTDTGAVAPNPTRARSVRPRAPQAGLGVGKRRSWVGRTWHLHRGCRPESGRRIGHPGAARPAPRSAHPPMTACQWRRDSAHARRSHAPRRSAILFTSVNAPILASRLFGTHAAIDGEHERLRDLGVVRHGNSWRVVAVRTHARDAALTAWRGGAPDRNRGGRHRGGDVAARGPLRPPDRRPRRAARHPRRRRRAARRR